MSQSRALNTRLVARSAIHTTTSNGSPRKSVGIAERRPSANTIIGPNGSFGSFGLKCIDVSAHSILKTRASGVSGSPWRIVAFLSGCPICLMQTHTIGRFQPLNWHFKIDHSHVV